MINTIQRGDALEILKQMPSEFIDCLITSPPYYSLRSYLPENHPDKNKELGLEPTFTGYIKKLCTIFDEAKRVLKEEGTCWINLGDSYASIGATGGDIDNDEGMGINRGRSRIKKGEYPEKCLLMNPERIALELINQGWILRNKIIWHKKNAMPSSVLDRWTNKYEVVYFFTKSGIIFFSAFLKCSKKVGGEIFISLASF